MEGHVGGLRAAEGGAEGRGTRRHRGAQKGGLQTGANRSPDTHELVVRVRGRETEGEGVAAGLPADNRRREKGLDQCTPAGGESPN